MLFNSYAFVLVFLPLALSGFFLLARLAGPSGGGLWLVAVSLVFYGWWNPACVPVLLVSLSWNYLFARLISATERRAGVQSAILLVGIASDLAALVYYKYLATLLVSVREGLESSESLVILSWAPIREVPDVVCGEPRPL